MVCFGRDARLNILSVYSLIEDIMRLEHDETFMVGVSIELSSNNIGKSVNKGIKDSTPIIETRVIRNMRQKIDGSVAFFCFIELVSQPRKLAEGIRWITHQQPIFIIACLSIDSNCNDTNFLYISGIESLVTVLLCSLGSNPVLP
jgi:hypothetical protein